jgi:hypothetical protein
MQISPEHEAAIIAAHEKLKLFVIDDPLIRTPTKTPKKKRVTPLGFAKKL